jgi:hypothetical protein
MLLIAELSVRNPPGIGRRNLPKEQMTLRKHLFDIPALATC